MTVKITKPSINVREKLSELDKETGIKGEELLRADTSAEAREALQLDQQLFTDFESTGIDDNATSTAVTIDSAGSVYIGSTSDSGTGYHRLSADGFVRHKRAAEIVAIFDRGTSNGDIVQFRKDGTTVGSIASQSDKIAVMAQADYGLKLFNQSGAGIFHPINTSGNAYDGNVGLGYSASRFKDLYLSGGVYLGGTVAANKLDDYEEGTWTPAYSTSGGSFSYDTATAGSYTKIGNVVTLYFRIYTTATTAGTGDVSITGIPFAEAITSGVGGGSIGDCRLFGGDMPDTLTVLGSAIFPYYRTAANGANTRLQASDLATVGGIQNLIDGQITYITT